MLTRRTKWKLVAGLLCGLVLAAPLQGAVAAVPSGIVSVSADGETTPVTTTGDSADDPAIWVNPVDPSRSVVIGNDKGDALEVYDLSGSRIQRISGDHGNVDVRSGFPTGTGTVDIAAAASGGIKVYRIDPTTRQLTNITEGSRISGVSGQGFCLYHSPVSGLFYAFIITGGGLVQQVRLGDADSDGLVDGQMVRSFQVGSESEGCVADDERGLFYVSQEDVALWRYGAEPGDAPSARVQVDSVGTGGNLVSDVEGLTIVYQANGTGYLLASVQNVADGNNNYYNVYERQGSNAYLKSFRVAAGPTADGCQRTDGIAAVAANLGPSFPSGLFVCQDNANTTPGSSGNQNFKLVRLEKILTLDGGGPPPPDNPPETAITSGPPASTTSTSATFTFTANEPGSTFTCTLDNAPAAGCVSPASYSNLAVGTTHHFEVAATDTTNHTDLTPATWDWTITAAPPPPPPPTAGTITTVAGTGGVSGFSGDGGAATSARLRGPRTMAADANGNLYITDTENNRIRKVDSTGKITTLAGTGTAGYSGDNGPATAARLNNPHGIAVDDGGNVYIADPANQRIRKVSPAGIITTLAGTGTSGYNGDNIAATAARLNYPKGVEVGPDGALYIGDANNHRVRRVDLSTGVITTVAGTGVQGASGDGGSATAARLNTPRNVTFAGNGDMYIADDLNFKVRKVDGVTKTITTVAGTGTAGFSGDGGSATSARLNEVRDVAVDAAGNLYIADEINNRIRWVDTAGIIRTFAGTGAAGFSGDGGPATSARIKGPRGVAVDAAGRVLIGDTANHAIRRVA